jgi:DNA-binding NarL/FixJ family response regulator
MTTNAKSAKKPRCKMASPISNDRAEAFVGPQAEVCPRFSEAPSERDARAFDLQAKGMTQRQIAQELKTSQSTVHRGIKKYRF